MIHYKNFERDIVEIKNIQSVISTKNDDEKTLAQVARRITSRGRDEDN